MQAGDGRLRGLEAVIDKDRATALLAVELKVRRLFITTGVDAIYRDYLDREKRTAIHHASREELADMLRRGEFPPGSMGPKVEAALYFLEHGGEEVVICRPEALADAFDGRAGTRIR
jgi:carbamate kinase